MLDQITEFKRFLIENFSNVGLISVIIAACLIVLSLALREVFSWLTKADKLRREVRDLKAEIRYLQSDIKHLTDKIQHLQAAELYKPEVEVKNNTATSKASAFPLNH